VSLAQFSNILWRERQLLELLLFKLEEEQLVLASGRSRWLSHATREVEMVLEQIKGAELVRAVEVAALGDELGLGANPSLRVIADVLESPWKGIFEQHRAAFLTASQEIQSLAQVNRDLLSRGQRATEEALEWLTEASGEPDLYSAAGRRAARVDVLPRLVNEAL
jgi:hypothetical protein